MSTAEQLLRIHAHLAAVAYALRKYSEHQSELCVQSVIVLCLPSGPVSARALEGRRGGAAAHCHQPPRPLPAAGARFKTER